MLAMLALVSAIAVLLVLTSRLSALLTVLLIGLLILAVNGSNWIIISYLPLSFAERNMVSTLVGILDFSIYVGAGGLLPADRHCPCPLWMARGSGDLARADRRKRSAGSDRGGRMSFEKGEANP